MIEDTVFQELAGIPRLAEAVQEQTHKQEHRKQIDQQFPMTAVWTAEKAQAQTRILLAIFKAFKEEKKGRNFAFMPSSFYAVLAPLWELWLRNNPTNDSEINPGSPAYISIPDARYQQERLLRSGVLRTGLLFYRDRPLEESTALALQSSGMECMTGAMSPEELVRRVNLFSSKVTEGMIPEAIKRELVPTPALLIAASEYIKVLWRGVFTSIGDAEFILEDNKKVQVPFMKTETFYTHKYTERHVDAEIGRLKSIKKEIQSIPMQQGAVLSLLTSDGEISDQKPLDLNLFRMPNLPPPVYRPRGGWRPHDQN